MGSDSLQCPPHARGSGVATSASFSRRARSPVMTRDRAKKQRFETLCEPYRGEVFRFSLWLSRSHQVAEEVVQETLLRAWRSLDSLKDDATAKSWLLTIARREHARLYERKRLPTVDIDDVEAQGDPALASDGDAGLEDLRRAILKLPDEYREPLVMQVLGGLTTNEIAEQLGLTQPAVLTRLFRARNRLREIHGLTPAEDVE